MGGRGGPRASWTAAVGGSRGVGWGAGRGHRLCAGLWIAAGLSPGVGGLKQRHLRVPLLRPGGERPDAGRPGWARGPLSTRPLRLRPCHCPRGEILGRSRGRAGGAARKRAGGGVSESRGRDFSRPRRVLAREGTQPSGREPRRAPGSAAPQRPFPPHAPRDPRHRARPPLAPRPLPTPVSPFPDWRSSNHRRSGKGHSLAEGHLGARPGWGIKNQGQTFLLSPKFPFCARHRDTRGKRRDGVLSTGIPIPGGGTRGAQLQVNARSMHTWGDSCGRAVGVKRFACKGPEAREGAGWV